MSQAQLCFLSAGIGKKTSYRAECKQKQAFIYFDSIPSQQ